MRSTGLWPQNEGIVVVPLIGEHLVHLDLCKLPLRVPVEAADADIADTLTFQDASDAECVRKESMTFGGMCQ